MMTQMDGPDRKNTLTTQMDVPDRKNSLISPRDGSDTSSNQWENSSREEL